MIKRLYNTNVMQAAEMLEVDDEFVLSCSKGEINKNDYEDDEENDNTKTSQKGTLIDPEIFERLTPDCLEKEESKNMGHIALSSPVVNVQYFKGKKPVLAARLKLSVKELEKVIYFSNYIVTEPGNSEYAYKQLLTIKEYEQADETQTDGFTVMIGPEAIKYLLEKENVPERKYIILNAIPVIPLSLRYAHYNKDESPCGEDVFTPLPINGVYFSVITQNNRLRRLKEMGAPSIIIMNETRMLQETVDKLISNGVRGKIRMIGMTNIPAKSLNEIFDSISRTSKEEKIMPETVINYNILVDRLKLCQEYTQDHDGDVRDDEGNETDEWINLCAAVNETVKDFVSEYVSTNYSRYEGLFERIFSEVTKYNTDILMYWFDKNYNYFEEDNELDITEPEDNVKKAFERGLMEQVDLFIRKRLKWCVEEV